MLVTMPTSPPLGKFILTRDANQHLSLVCKDNSFKPFSIDFTDNKFIHRLQAIGKHQPIARAIGIKAEVRPKIIDATAGMGTDAILLAALGCEVTLIEQSDIVAKLLADALARAAINPLLNPIVARMNLLHGDSVQLIPTLPKADVIYLDPMFPTTKNTAKVKKPMQILQQLIGHQSEETLFNTALAHADRVVLKRPKKLNLTPPKGCQVIDTKTTQYLILMTGNKLK